MRGGQVGGAGFSFLEHVSEVAWHVNWIGPFKLGRGRDGTRQGLEASPPDAIWGGGVFSFQRCPAYPICSDAPVHSLQFNPTCTPNPILGDAPCVGLVMLLVGAASSGTAGAAELACPDCSHF